jgi:hypothetical protein
VNAVPSRLRLVWHQKRSRDGNLQGIEHFLTNQSFWMSQAIAGSQTKETGFQEPLTYFAKLRNNTTKHGDVIQHDID